jgi:hypothetical protein
VDGALVDIYPRDYERPRHPNDAFNEGNLFRLFSQAISEAISSQRPATMFMKFKMYAEGWLDDNNRIFEIIPHMIVKNWEIQVYRDRDNTLKMLVSNDSFNKEILKIGDLKKLKNHPMHPWHAFQIYLDNEKARLTVDIQNKDSIPKEKSF